MRSPIAPGSLAGIFYYEQGPSHYNGTLGLPSSTSAASTFTSGSNANALFTLQPYTAANTLDLGAATATGTLTLTTPGSYSDLSLLDAKASNGQTLNYSLNFTSGVPTTGSFTCGDWNALAGATPAISAGLTSSSSPPTNSSPGFSTGYLWENDIALSAADQQRTLVSIDFSVANSGSGNIDWIMGLSGTAVPEPTSLSMLGLAGIALMSRRRRIR